jgi:hypothetical protein
MTSYTLQREELLALLNKAGASTAQGMSDDFLRPLSADETVSGGEFNSEQLALANLLAHPHTVVHAIRFNPNNVIQESVWFYSAGIFFASLAAVEDGYELSALDNLETLIFKAGAILPLHSDSETLPARVVLDQDDFTDVRYLLSNWHEVSGEMVLEAAGLEKFEAVNLAHSVQSQEWHGRLTFKFYKNDQLVSERELRGLQSTDTCWLGYLDPETGKMIVQTATPETMDTVALRIWQALDES